MDLVDQFWQYLMEDGKNPATIVSYIGDIRVSLGTSGAREWSLMERYSAIRLRPTRST